MNLNKEIELIDKQYSIELQKIMDDETLTDSIRYNILSNPITNNKLRILLEKRSEIIKRGIESVISVKFNNTVYNSNGDLMTVEEFNDNVICGGFIDYDGWGYLANNSYYSDVMVKPSNFNIWLKKQNQLNFTHILWFNK